jgi:hypothetical protein
LPGEMCVACFAATSAEAVRAGEPPIRHSRGPTANIKRETDEKGRPTLAGCFLTLLSVAVIFGSAVPIVTWRDPETGLPIPRMLAIAAPFLAGGLCYAVGAAILRLLGLPLFKKTPDSNGSDAE